MAHRGRGTTSAASRHWQCHLAAGSATAALCRPPDGMPYGTDLTAILCTAVASATAGAALMRGCMAAPAPHPPVSRCPARARQNQSTPGSELPASSLDATAGGVSSTGPDVEIEYCTVRMLPLHNVLVLTRSCCKINLPFLACRGGVHAGLQVEPQGGVDGARVSLCKTSVWYKALQICQRLVTVECR